MTNRGCFNDVRDQIERNRAAAESLLKDLMAAQASAERGDLFRAVAGQSAMEKSITETRRLIAACDRLLGELNRADSQTVQVVTTLRPKAPMGVAV
ncbi:MAG TPA: hypothetical protein VD971_06685 [Phycisphaerales bacterium]|nr:hypothetical protein [Phycisphaerales bacterium]